MRPARNAHRPALRLSLGIVGWIAVFPLLAGDERPAPDVRRDIRPLLADRCFRCHGPDERARKGGLRLDRRDSVLRPAESGLVPIVPGDPESSELVRRILSDGRRRMPPRRSKLSLSDAERRTIIDWIAAGAPYERHWAFEPLRRPPVPSVQRTAWPRNPIDAFVLHRLERENVEPSPAVGRRRLIRRLSLDLLGLPPSTEEVDAFASDRAPGAWERCVDRLLASPAFGERMTWDWLDAARYADSNGYQGDRERTMWPWRDWVIDALNRNLPYDEFTVWQLAGDLLPGATGEQKLATGFCRNHMINGEGGRIAEENRVDYVMDMTETMSTVWLGLTMTCCRCHDHKYDPLSQRDYYGLFAFFNQTPVDGGGGDPQTPPVLAVPDSRQAAELARLEKLLVEKVASVQEAEKNLPAPAAAPAGSGTSGGPDGTPEEIRKILGRAVAGRNAGQLGKLEAHWEKREPEYAARVRELRETFEHRDATRHSIPKVMVMEDRATPRATFRLEKGLYNRPGEEVSARVPETLPPLADSRPVNRLALARWLVSPDNPLTARVTVNRVWQRFFGTGLVKTTEDFGTQGEEPSHPELLDWLASELQRSGWDLKRLCRLIATSATYRQSSRVSRELLERDPENRLLARATRFRLPSWMIRDQALAVSGLLVRRLGGPPVFPYQPPGIWQDVTFGKKKYEQDRGENLYRRSIYTFWRRIIGPTVFFDSASRQNCTVRQSRTNTPLHALTILNETTYVEAARVLAAAVLRESPGATARELVAASFRRILLRPPRREEAAVLGARLRALETEFLADPEAARRLLSVGESPPTGGGDAPRHAALTAVCNVLLNLDETVTRE